MKCVGHDLRGHTNEVHANELRRRQEQSTATDRALMDSTNVVQETASHTKQQAATGQCPALNQYCCVLDVLHFSTRVKLYDASPHNAWLELSVQRPSCHAWLL